VKSSRPFLLLKFSKSLEHLTALRDHGLVYMNTLEYFRQLEEKHGSEDDDQIGDKFEGSSRIWQPEQTELTFDFIGFQRLKVKAPDLAGVVTLHPHNFSAFNVFCTTSVELSAIAGNIQISEEKCKLGKWVLLLNPKPFSDRLEAATKAANYRLHSNFVDYRDYAVHSGPTGPFLKSNKFKHQDEFRFIVDRDIMTCEPFKLVVGSLKGHSQILPTEQVNELTYKLPEDSIGP
jgi:hypothetical protein